MVRYVGIDLHKRLLVFCILDAQGKVFKRLKLTIVTREALTAFCQEHLQAEDRVAMEATTNTWAVVRVLKPFVAEVVVSNPLQTKAIAQAKVKTDKVDSHILAQLLRLDFLPRVWQPEEKDQKLREWTARRSRLVSMRTAAVNRIHSALAQRLIACEGDLDSKAGRAWLASLELDEDARWLIDSDLRLLDTVIIEIDAIDKRLAKTGYEDPRVKLLMTLPGVSQHTAQTLLAAMGDVHRFRDAKSFASYLGLVPSTRQSADKCYHGRITKAGRAHTRWMLVQAAQATREHPGPLGFFFRKLKRRKNHNVAVVAVAHKLAMLAWHILKSSEPYRYALPDSTEEKLRKLRVRATGERRSSGPSKGTPPKRAGVTIDQAATANEAGSSAATKARKQAAAPRAKAAKPRGARFTKPLGEVFKSEGLPEIRPAPPGEQRVLKEQGLTPFAESLCKPQPRGGRRQTKTPSAS